ncbi:hypothetical protein NDR87_08790 [Nocardia sp. CDC159]|uniref:Secreted protein n=1 Tax=Nocardia pulmonis TaxID=2951408 RepID=A0A9X2E3J5_9NOCA|nr:MULTISPECIES: hypothetical protein [Nocardia]MCM6773564.1 hypothetical protein [Nocardia pulmonis]MCM6786451.1 hypothetical protein [Nocardia sp. CDC159]
MRSWATILGVAAVLAMPLLPAAAAESQPEPAAGELVTHWQLSHGDTRTEGDIYWGPGRSTRAYGWITAAGDVHTVCYNGSNGELGGGGGCTTARPGRTEHFGKRFVVEAGQVHRIDVSIFKGAAPTEDGLLASLYCTREGCEVLPR